MLPGEHAVDSGYVSADLLVSSRLRGITLLGPLLAGTSAQARSGGYTADMFAIDWDRRQATCPQGAASSKWAPLRQRDGKEAISVRFAAATCRACPARDKCTTAKWTGRQLFLRPREIHEAVAAARAGQDTRQWKDRYKTRAGVEGLMHQATCVTGIRRARYLGLGQDPPGAPRRRHRHQRDPARRLVHRQAPGQDPDNPPSAHRPRARDMSPN